MDAQSNRIALSKSDIPRVSLSTDKKDNKFYVGEDAIITAKFISSLVVCKVVWQKSTDGGSHVHDIDTTLPKYTETRNENGDHLLMIKNCDESDSGTYIPMLSFEKFVFYSDEIVLKVEKGSPEVTLQDVPSVALHTRVHFTATIRGFPKYQSVIWKKDNEDIDINNPKFERNDDSTVLYIKNVKKEDEGIYTIEAINELGNGQSSQELKVIGDVPEVAFDEIPPAQLNERLELKATIRSVPKYLTVIWKKDNEDIDITDPKYETSEDTNDDSVVLCIKNAKKEDEGIYTIEVFNEIGMGQKSQQLEFIGDVPEVTFNEKPQAKLNERLEFKATIRSVPQYHKVIWKKDNKDIDITDPKYETSENTNDDSVILCIKTVKKEDEGNYTIEVYNEIGMGQKSQQLEIIGGWPEVILKQVPPAFLDESVEFKAIMKAFPTHDIVLWKKDNQEIDINNPKYEMSVNKNDDSATLCIKNIKNEDEGIYTIEVRSELGDSQSSQTLIVIKATQRIFIAGPVVVSSKEEIIFEAYLPGLQLLNLKWWKKKDGSTKEIGINSEKYSSTKDQNNKYKFIISNAEEEDSAEYQISSTDMKSNAIYVHVDDSEKFSTGGQGNCIRFYALQNVSANAMRRVFFNLPDTCENTMKQIKRDCQAKKKAYWAKNVLNALQGKDLSTPDGLDISVMYTILKRSKLAKPTRGWGKRPYQNATRVADDVERIHFHRNKISHLDASEMETAVFNKLVLDLIGAIRRLSKDDHKLMSDCCVILNKVFTTLEFNNTIETFEEEPEELGQHILNEEETKKNPSILSKSFGKKSGEFGLHFSNEDIHDGAQRIEQCTENADIIFHDVCDSSISIQDNSTTAIQKKIRSGGVCFLNRPMTPEEEMHIRGKRFNREIMHIDGEAYLQIGLTNNDPENVRKSVDKKRASGSRLELINCIKEKRIGIFSEEFHLCISLCSEHVCSISICINGTQYYYKYPEVSIFKPLWLVIEPYDMESIELSNG